MLFFLGLFTWILDVPGYSSLHHTLLAIYLGSYFGVFGLLYNFLLRHLGMVPALMAAPCIWVCLEYIRSHLSFLALPWGLLAHSQYRFIPVIQISSFFGAYGLSFLIVIVNAALTCAVVVVSQRLPKGLNWERGWPAMVAAPLLFVLTWFYGYITISGFDPGKAVMVSAVQGNIDQRRKWDETSARDIMQVYTELTLEASARQPSLIIWPETATPRSIQQDLRLYRDVVSLARHAGTYLLLGSSHHQKFSDRQAKEFHNLNSAFLLRPDAKLERPQRYDKIKLLPFGEYLPWKGTIPWKLIGVPDVSEYVPGEVPVILEMPGARFGVTICWENIFPDIVRASVRSGAQFIVNITNEAWFGKTAAPYQFLSMSVFRAVENRVYVVRAANSGVSCIIDPYGRIVERVSDARGEETFIRGITNGWVVPTDSKTFYNRHGDILVLVSFLVVVATTVAAMLVRCGHVPEKRCS